MNTRQKAFVEAYIGNATQAAIIAGYSKHTAKEQGCTLLTKPNIARAIAEREAMRSVDRIAGAEEILETWSAIMRDETTEKRDIISAANSLAKAGGMFIDRVQTEHEVRVIVASEDDQKALEEAL